MPPEEQNIIVAGDMRHFEQLFKKHVNPDGFQRTRPLVFSWPTDVLSRFTEAGCRLSDDQDGTKKYLFVPSATR